MYHSNKLLTEDEWNDITKFEKMRNSRDGQSIKRGIIPASLNNNKLTLDSKKIRNSSAKQSLRKISNINIADKSCISPRRSLYNRIPDLKLGCLPDLDPINNINKSKYLGPTTSSNWVIPELLLVGGYPGNNDDEINSINLLKIMSKGVGIFVCLQAEYDPTISSREQWIKHDGLRPYFKDVEQLYNDHNNWVNIDRPNTIEFIHLPIKDLSTSLTDLALFGLCIHLIQRLENGEKIYIHCLGGHGRTGIVVSILLGMIYGLNAEQAMKYCQITHDQRVDGASVSSPQTIEQREQVKRILTSISVLKYKQFRISNKYIYDPISNKDIKLNTESLFYKQFTSDEIQYEKKRKNSLVKTPKSTRSIYNSNFMQLFNKQKENENKNKQYSINTYNFIPTVNQPLTHIVHFNKSTGNKSLLCRNSTNFTSQKHISENTNQLRFSEIRHIASEELSSQNDFYVVNNIQVGNITQLEPNKIYNLGENINNNDQSPPIHIPRHYSLNESENKFLNESRKVINNTNTTYLNYNIKKYTASQNRQVFQINTKPVTRPKSCRVRNNSVQINRYK